MDAFHSRTTGSSRSNTQNQQEDSSYRELYTLSERRKNDLLVEISDTYDQDILRSEEVSEAVSEIITLYRLGRQEEGVIYVGEDREELEVEELGELREVVDRYLEGESDELSEGRKHS